MPRLYNDIKINQTNRGISYYINAVYPEIPFTSEDKYIISAYEDRLDLLAYDYYGDEELWWVISRANPDVTRRDSFFIKSGEKIRIPDESIIDSLLLEFEKINARR